jgi:Holliday junction resolvase-like predicted endonuclease
LMPARQRNIIQMAQSFLAQKCLTEKNIRFDVVALTVDVGNTDS